MDTIWKFELKVADEQLLEMPVGSLLLDVQLQNNSLQLWARVDPEQPKIKRKIIIHGTGHPVKETTGNHLGTFQSPDGALVFHVFEGV